MGSDNSQIVFNDLSHWIMLKNVVLNEVQYVCGFILMLVRLMLVFLMVQCGLCSVK